MNAAKPNGAERARTPVACINAGTNYRLEFWCWWSIWKSFPQRFNCLPVKANLVPRSGFELCVVSEETRSTRDVGEMQSAEVG